jgi:predicted SAM-dependent methyltransferase|tara:strand:+ start:65 stop:715 length:651 start_codon:yes stop_codon:yes gene_type:complete
MLSFDGENFFKFHLKRSVQFALIAKIKRFFLPKIRTPKHKYINIGCGFHKFEEFDNLDFYSSSFSFWKKGKYIPHDFRYKLPFEDNSFEGAFSEHTLEHLYFDESEFLLREICRVLKKTSIFRCAVPGLKIYIENYMKKKKDEYFSQFENGCDALRDLVCNWGHLSIWDEITLKREMLKSGFSTVRICEFGNGENKDLIKDLEVHKHQTIYLEAKK